jgi:hypothetical protein
MIGAALDCPKRSLKPMKTLICCAAAIAIAGMTVPADAKGCIKGAVVGGIAGHAAGHHAVLGAVSGCIVGHHLAKRHEQESQTPADANQQPATPPAGKQQ